MILLKTCATETGYQENNGASGLLGSLSLGLVFVGARNKPGELKWEVLFPELSALASRSANFLYFFSYIFLYPLWVENMTAFIFSILLLHSNLLIWSLILFLTLTKQILAIAFSLLVASTTLSLHPPFLESDLAHNYTHTATSPPPKPLSIPASNPLHKPSRGLHKTCAMWICFKPRRPSWKINPRDLFPSLFHLSKLPALFGLPRVVLYPAGVFY